MISRLIELTNRKYQNRHVKLVKDDHMMEGIYLGSWKTNCFTVILFCHHKQKAEIKHFKIEERYCLKCKCKKQLIRIREISLRDGRQVQSGACPYCGKIMYWY